MTPFAGSGLFVPTQLALVDSEPGLTTVIVPVELSVMAVGPV